MNNESEIPTKKHEHSKVMSKIRMRFNRLVYVEFSPRYIRLKGDLHAYKEHLHVLQMDIDSEKKKKDWTTKALALCVKALEKLKKREIDEGWKIFHAAKRLEVYNNEFSRKAMTTHLREETVKLSEHRKNSILKIIGVGHDKRDSDISPEELERALRIRDEYYQTLYYTNRLTRGQFNWLFLILALLIILILIYIARCNFSGDEEMTLMNFRNLTGVILFGMLGATTSSIFHFRNSHSSARIPEILSNSSITFSRILVGAGFSIFIFVLMNSEIAKAINVFNFELDSCYEFFTIAFASGFSERLALKSIQKIIGDKEK
jgi:hypothetical protein